MRQIVDLTCLAHREHYWCAAEQAGDLDGHIGHAFSSVRRFAVERRVLFDHHLSARGDDVVVTHVRVVHAVVAVHRRQQVRGDCEGADEVERVPLVGHGVRSVAGFECVAAPVAGACIDRHVADRFRAVRRRGRFVLLHRHVEADGADVRHTRMHVRSVVGRLHLTHHDRRCTERNGERHRRPAARHHSAHRGARVDRPRFKPRAVGQLPQTRLDHHPRHLLGRVQTVLVRGLLQIHREPIRLHIIHAHHRRLTAHI